MIPAAIDHGWREARRAAQRRRSLWRTLRKALLALAVIILAAGSLYATVAWAVGA